jgi:hypothetical protein
MTTKRKLGKVLVNATKTSQLFSLLAEYHVSTSSTANLHLPEFHILEGDKESEEFFIRKQYLSILWFKFKSII